MSLLLALTGGSAGAYTLTADAGSYSLSGQSSNVLRSKRLVAVSGAYALTGVAAGILHSYKLNAVSGTYTLTGVAAIISYTPIAGAYVLTANAGVYTLNGSAAAVLHSHRLTSATGAYALNGLPANVYRNKKLASNAGAYSYLGNAANIVYTPITSGYTLTANSGSYVLNGKDAGIVVNSAGIQPIHGYNFENDRRLLKARRDKENRDKLSFIEQLEVIKPKVVKTDKQAAADFVEHITSLIPLPSAKKITDKFEYKSSNFTVLQSSGDDDEAIALLIAALL